MRALSALAGIVRRGIEDPSEALTGDLLLSSIEDPSQLWGKAGGRDPMRLATAGRCVQILAGTVAGCPLKVFNRDTLVEQDIRALSMPRVGQTPYELWSTVVAHMATRGNAYVRKVRAAGGRIVELVPIAPTRVVVHVEAGEDAAAVGMPFVKRFEIDGGKTHLSEFEVMHIPALSLDGVTGVSAVEYYAKTFDIAHNADELASRVYGKGLLMSGFLSSSGSLTEDKASILRSRWRARFSGMDNAHDVGVLDSGATFQQVSLSPVDAQFIEARRFQKSEIATIYGIPGWLVNDQEKSTSWGSGMEQQFLAFVTVTLKAYFQRIEQRVAREIADPATEKVEFKLEGLLRGDSKSRSAFYTAGISGGWMTPNDVRALEDLPPVPWGDEPYRPFNESAAAQADDNVDNGGSPNDHNADA